MLYTFGKACEEEHHPPSTNKLWADVIRRGREPAAHGSPQFHSYVHRSAILAFVKVGRLQQTRDWGLGNTAIFSSVPTHFEIIALTQCWREEKYNSRNFSLKALFFRFVPLLLWSKALLRGLCKVTFTGGKGVIH